MPDRTGLDPTSDPGSTGTGPGLERVRGGPGRGVAIVAVLVVSLVIVAIARPWDLAAGPAPGSSASSPVALATMPPPATPATPAHTPAPTPAPSYPPWFDGSVPPCMGQSVWLLVAEEKQPGGAFRIWSRPHVVIGAAGPDDPGIRWSRVTAASVPVIGVCLPNAPSLPDSSSVPGHDGTSIVVWGSSDGEPGAEWSGASGWRVLATEVVARDVATTGGLFAAPAPGTGDADGSWKRGRYVVEVRSGTFAPSTWIGVEIERPASRSPVP